MDNIIKNIDIDEDIVQVIVETSLLINDETPEDTIDIGNDIPDINDFMDD